MVPANTILKMFVAADEWAENVDNNAFTNAAAKAVLQHATEAAKLLGIVPNADWMNVADNIPIIKMPDGVTSEYAGYDGRGIKQADVNLLAYPLKEITNTTQIKKDLAFYETRVPNEGTPRNDTSGVCYIVCPPGRWRKSVSFFPGRVLA